MKKIVSLMMIFIIAFSLCVFSESDIKVNLDGRMLSFDQPAVIVEGRTLVPVRKIFEELGAKVEWNEKTQTVLSKTENLEVRLTINDNIMLVNGEEKILDVPAQIINSRTLVPARAVAEAFGCFVDWNAKNSTVIIKTQDYTSREAVFQIYVSEDFKYSMLYPITDNYTLTNDKNISEYSDFILIDSVSNSSLNVTALENEKKVKTLTEKEINAILETEVSDYKTEYINSIPSVSYTYSLDGVYIKQIMYFTDDFVYTVTLGVSDDADLETVKDLEFTMNSLGI